MTALIATILTDEHLRQVYPLIELHHRELTLDAWLAFAQRHQDGNEEDDSRGFLALKDYKGVVKGLVQYWIDFELSEGPVMRAAHLLAIGVLPGDGRRISEAMVLSLEQLAKRKGCRALYLSQALTEGLRWPAAETLDPSAFGLHLSHWTTRKAL